MRRNVYEGHYSVSDMHPAQPSTKKKCVILGAGPAGLSLAMRLLRRFGDRFDVVLIDRRPTVGGMSSSFTADGLTFDYGSHRLHPVIASDALEDIRNLIGDDLLERPRRGRICMMNRFVRFPLTLGDSLKHLPLSFLAGLTVDMIRLPFQTGLAPRRTFADELLSSLGSTICRSFYFPFSEKLWGLPPERLSADQARRRVTQKGIVPLIRKVIGAGIPFRRNTTGRYYYPRKGYGQISDAMAEEVRRLGGTILLSTRPGDIQSRENGRFAIRTESRGLDSAARWQADSLMTADLLFSTIPIHALVNALNQKPPASVTQAVSALRYRCLVLVYLILETPRFSPFECHYFPERRFIFSRISEPKHYSAVDTPKNATGLCAEIPCWKQDSAWDDPDERLGAKVIADLRESGMPVTVPVRTVFTKRLSNAYPVYALDYARNLNRVERYLEGIPNLIRLGRQAIFLHDNIHHALAMGALAADCVRSDGGYNIERWRAAGEQFLSYTVED